MKTNKLDGSPQGRGHPVDDSNSTVAIKIHRESAELRRTIASDDGEVELVVTIGPRRDQVSVEAHREGDTINAATMDSRNSERRFKFAKSVKIPDAELAQAISDFLSQPAIPAPEVESAFVVRMRGLQQPRDSAIEYTAEIPLDALKAALAVRDCSSPEPVLEWEDVTQLAALDVDFHDLPQSGRPSPEQLTAMANAIRPKPAFSWVSHGRGLKLVYAKAGGLDANELAACATLSVRSLAPTATTEIMSQTRHPGYPRPQYPDAGQIMAMTPDADLGVLDHWIGQECDESVIADYLAERGLERGRHYEHQRCPVAPEELSHGEPVFIGDDAVFCHKCEAAGISVGRSRPGLFPFALLIVGGIPSRLLNAARHFCHWEHACLIMDADLGLVGELGRLCYTALLKVVHGRHDPRIPAAMSRGRGLVRRDGYWATPDLAKAHGHDGLKDRLQVLPVVQFVVRDEEGRQQLRTDSERLGIFRGVDDLSWFGYPAVRPIRGIKLAGRWTSANSEQTVQATVLPDHLRPDDMRKFRPRYTPLANRMPRDEAEGVLSESFPGINHNYVRLLIAARGCSESGTGQPPRIAVDGPSGAGKSLTATITAGMLGDSCTDVTWTANTEHFQQGLFEASVSSGFATCDEIIKLASVRGGNVLAALTALLTFGRGSSVRLLYIGPVRVTDVPALIITDIAFPQALHHDEQFGRRFMHVHLDRKVDWQKSARTGVEQWRVRGIRESDAANAIISYVIDEFFADDVPPVFEDIARALGFSLLHEVSLDGINRIDDLLQLFHACCDLKAVSAAASTWKGRGWCLVRRDGTDVVSNAWRAVCDDQGDGFVSSRRVKEIDWASALGSDEPVECDISPHGQTSLAIRFRVGDARSPKMQVNQEIRRCDTTGDRGGTALPEASTSPSPHRAEQASGSESLREEIVI